MPDELKLVTVASVKFGVLKEFAIDGVDYKLLWSPTTRELTVEPDVDCEDDSDEE